MQPKRTVRIARAPQDKRYRSASAVQSGGRKRHGSHRSHIIGAYEFKRTPVTELHQPGVIWQ